MTPENTPTDEKKPILEVNIDDVQLAALIDSREKDAAKKWNEAPYSLDKTRESNQKLYSTDYINDWVIDERYEDVVADNRMFTSVRTIVPFVTSQITEPEVIAANGDDLSRQFAGDFEQILSQHAKNQQAKAKIKVAVQDNLRGQRIGYLKWRYDATKNDVVLEHVDPKSVIIDGKARLHEEPRFLQHTQERTVGQLVKQFPEKKEVIHQLFELDEKDPDYLTSLEAVQDITETWMFTDVDGEDTLIVVWKYKHTVLGKCKDPNWVWDGDNLLDSPMIPFIFFNFLNDGSSLIDQTSYMEQSQYLQNNYDKRSMAIAANAKYGGIGVPIFAKGAIPQQDAAKVQFSPVQRVLLDTDDVRSAFTTWQAGTLQNFVVEDKYDSRNSIDNIWGTPNIMRGEQSKNNTLGQDVLIRDQAEGRQSEIIDAIDVAMGRFYQILGQMIYRYFDEDKYYKFIGENGQFTRLVISQKKLAENLGIGIQVRTGSSLPVDRSQKRAVALKLAQINKISTLRLYKELGFEEPEAAFKEYLLELKDPASLLKEVDANVFDREAEEDLAIVIGGETPEERDDISETYINYLNEYLTTDKYRMLQKKDTDAAERVSTFIQAIVEKAQAKVTRLQAMETARKLQEPASGVPPVPTDPSGAPLSPEEAARQAVQGQADPNAPQPAPQAPAVPAQAPTAPVGV